jgi:hypothetical protein
MKSLLMPLAGITLLILTSCDKNGNGYETPPPPPPPPVNATVFSAAGDSLGVAGKIADFRTAMGTGNIAIGWDGVPDDLSNADNFPGDFFGNSDPNGPAGRKRGLVMNGAPAFRVSKQDFSEIEPSYDAQFNAFSKPKTFMSSGSVFSDMNFKVPGTLTPAFVKGFAVVFSDVDDASSTTLEFFNDARSLGVYKAPVRVSASGFSFLGVFFPDEKVTRVRIKSGAAPLGLGVKDKSDGGADLVVMDDFFYNLPVSQQ